MPEANRNLTNRKLVKIRRMTVIFVDFNIMAGTGDRADVMN